MLDLNKLKQHTNEIRKQRQSNGAKMMSPLKHCATEVVEASQAQADYDYALIQLTTGTIDEIDIEDIKKDLGSELSDIIICALNCADDYDIDIEQSLRYTVEKNELRAKGKDNKK